ncbi:MAG: glycosyltransferase family 2 protein [bacterium]|nr:glycosyltransferase family 2 protein [bacterium]
MLKKIAIIISPNWHDYAEKYLNDCLMSLRKQDYQGEKKIFITDNESSENSFNFLKQVAPEAEIIRNEKNDGFAKGNNDAIKLALEQKFDYIVLFNMDTVIELNCISKMIEVAENGNKIGAVQARLMLWPEKEKINSIGNVTHFLGFGYSEGYNKKYKLIDKCKEICYPSGAGVLFTADIFKKVGLFDEEFWMYNEDQDLGWRIWLAGFKCVLASEAVAFHKYEFSRSIKKYYWMDRNRIIVILKNYHLVSLILIFPAFVVMEIGLIFFAIKSGWIKEKILVYKYFFNFKNWRYILNSRKQSQNLRKVKDKNIIKLFSGKIWYQEIEDSTLKIANVIFSFYWKIVKRIIVW